jgi:hypothetical protein
VTQSNLDPVGASFELSLLFVGYMTFAPTSSERGRMSGRESHQPEPRKIDAGTPAKKKWQKPEVRVLKAGAAEHLAGGKPDGAPGSKS